MSDKTKAATAEVASKNSASVEKKVSKKEKKFSNPFNESDPLQAKMVNCLMQRGKKTVARKILRDTFEEMFRRGAKDPLVVFEQALQNATPTMEVRPRRVGGAIYQIPVEVKPQRQESLPVRWILTGARSKKGQPMYKRLATELMDCSMEQGVAFNKKLDVHKMAQANKAFAHLARY